MNEHKMNFDEVLRKKPVVDLISDNAVMWDFVENIRVELKQTQSPDGCLSEKIITDSLKKAIEKNHGEIEDV